MDSLNPIRTTIKFGTYEFDLAARELRKGKRKIKLQDQPFQVLAMLLRAPRTLVTREELRQELWAVNTFVDFEHGLNRAISKLREALGDSATSPKYIETVARHGYRFIARTGALQPSSVGRKLRLAVLPCNNLSGDPAEEFFSDGMTEEMIAQLGQLEPGRLGVIARTSAMQYKGSNKSIDQIGRELKVDYILEGSVRRAADRVRVTAQLIGVADQTHLWAESYDCESKDLLAIQSDIAGRVRRSLAAALLPPEQPQESHVAALDSAAYDAYLKGRYFWSKRHEGALKRAIECFKRATDLDPSLARAYSGLADSYALSSWYGEVPPKVAGPAARSAAIKAVQLDGEIGEAHASLALIRFWYEWDWRGAEMEFQRALRLAQNYATAHQWFASYLVAMGRFEEASAELQRALELDPLSLIIVQSLGDPYFYSGRYDEAIEQYRKTIEMNPGFAPAHFSLGRAYEQKGMYREGIAEFQKANAISGKMEAAPAMAHALALAGEKTKATAILDKLIRRSQQSYVSPVAIALIYLGLHQEGEALEWIHRAVEDRSCWLVYAKVDPALDPIRGNATFHSLMKRVGLEKPHSVAA